MNILQRIGAWLRPLKWPIRLFTLLALLVFLAEAIKPELLFQQDYLSVAILCVLWGINAQLVMHGFAIENGLADSWWQRFKQKVKRITLTLLSIAFVILTVVSVWLTIRLLLVTQ